MDPLLDQHTLIFDQRRGRFRRSDPDIRNEHDASNCNLLPDLQRAVRAPVNLKHRPLQSQRPRVGKPPLPSEMEIPLHKARHRTTKHSWHDHSLEELAYEQSRG